ncbi:apolipoprotein N-acyltransferase [Gordonia effusa NBRC 100432]|uniref:Apolipoprotein N-acyltransferase n=1 Tax=Gordonia effusa NBRC 100432 TaxID=1077974 RepID=H0R071_9ACTN|nr:apolipoprotein N-acyltransferase [Gordonia effusa NBRC 100432]
MISKAATKLRNDLNARDWGWRTAVGAMAGGLMWAAFPPRNLWFLAVASLGLLAVAIGAGRPSVRQGAWIGFVFGLAFFIPLLPWIGVYVGPLPWLALAVVLSIYLALFGVMATVTMRLPVPPLWFALSWVAVETARSSFPFGGFPWGRAAFSQVDGPLLPLAAAVGATGLSFGVALFGASAAWLLVMSVQSYRRSAAVDAPRPDDRHPLRSTRLRTAMVVFVLALVAPVAAIALTPESLDKTLSPSTATVAVIQGNVPRLGLDFNAQRRAVLDNHVKETQRLAAAIHAGSTPHPDLVVWPENASDISPLTNPDAAQEITDASLAVGAPILVGTLVSNPDGRYTNTVLTWQGAHGPVGRYDKHIVQPFGEYLPWRSFFRLFSSYADMAGDFKPGTGSSVLTVPGTSGPVRVGVSTCWEVAFDRSARAAVDQGAQLLYVPTNNATFGRTEMTYQQLAMSQVRAVEHGRTVLVAATSGISAIVAPDGTITAQSEFFTPDTLAARVVLHSQKTVATRLGGWPTTVLTLFAICGFLFAIATRTRLSRRLNSMPGVPQGNGTTIKEPDGSRD